jgi:hypothetical protein
VPARISPVERVRAEIDQLFADPARDLGDVIEDVARLGARLLLQTALEAEVTTFLGRERYERDPDAGPGHRNGHRPVTVKTTSGPLTLERPKLRGTDQRFASQLLGAHVTRTNALEALVIAGFVRGLSTHDVEASLAKVLGPQAALSRLTVSRICEAISSEFTTWSARSLANVELDYLYLDCNGWRTAHGTAHQGRSMNAAFSSTDLHQPVLGSHPAHRPVCRGVGHPASLRSAMKVGRHSSLAPDGRPFDARVGQGPQLIHRRLQSDPGAGWARRTRARPHPRSGHRGALPVRVRARPPGHPAPRTGARPAGLRPTAAPSLRPARPSRGRRAAGRYADRR